MKRIGKGRIMSMPGGILTGVGIGLAVSMIGAMALAWLIVTERAGENWIGYGAMVIIAVGAMTSSLASWVCLRHNRLKVTIIACAAFYGALLCIGLLFGGGLEGIGTTAAMVTAGGAMSLIPVLIGGGSGVRRRKIPAFR